MNLRKDPVEFRMLEDKALFPDEQELWDNALIHTGFHSGDHCLALPTLNLQFLSVHDYLLCNFNIYRLEIIHQIKSDIEESIGRMSPRTLHEENGDITTFDGWSKMSAAVTSFKHDHVFAPIIGKKRPAKVLASISYTLQHHSADARKEWDAELKKSDPIMLIGIFEPKIDQNDQKNYRKKYGIKYVRGGEVHALFGEGSGAQNMESNTSQRDLKHSRRMTISLDTNQYYHDKVNHRLDNVTETINVIIRRKPNENNFKSVLSTIQQLIQEQDVVIPSWLKSTFLGYGDPASAHYKTLMTTSTELNIRDTFISEQHARDSFPRSSY